MSQAGQGPLRITTTGRLIPRLTGGPLSATIAAGVVASCPNRVARPGTMATERLRRRDYS